MQAIIMAAGKSTRTYPLTLTRPKPLLPVANKPILAWHLDGLKGLVDEVVVIVGYRKDQIIAAFGNEYDGIRLTYVEQTEQRGTGHAVLQCAEHIHGPFMAFNGDDLYDPRDVRNLAAAEHPSALVKYVEDPRLYGIYEVTEENRVVRLVEKPVEIFSHLANIGAYKFWPDVFDILRTTPESPRGEIEITSAIETLARDADFRVVPTEGYWLPIGYPWHLLDANAYMLENHFEPVVEGGVSALAELNGAVAVGKGTTIRAGVVIDGPVMIGENCSIGPNCWLRPGTTIGNGCRVGQGSEIKNSILFDGAAAPHLNYVGDSVLGEKTNLGCGTVTANYRHDATHHKSVVGRKLIDTGRKKLGAIMGDHVHTGINTSIYPGRKMWPHTSTLPGEVVRKDITGGE